MGKEEIYLIDGSAYIYRAYHGVAPLSNSKGVQTNAVFGFVNILRRLLREKNPKYLAVAFDSRGKVFRHHIYPEYKANRPSMPGDLAEQIPFIKEFVEASNILTLEEEGVEADDLIASAATVLSGQGHRVVVVSGDKDLLQLVGEKVVMWDPMNDRLMNREAVAAKYNVRVDQLLEMFALMGDSSDNIPGVPGIGPKTAEKLINEYGSLDNIFQSVDQMKKSKMKERLVENRQAAYLSRELIRLKEDVPIPEELGSYAIQEADSKRLAAIFGELEFTTFLKEIDTSRPIPVEGFQLVVSEKELAQLVAAVSDAEVVAIDTETTSLDARTATLVGVSLCVDLDQAWYVPLGHKQEDCERVAGQLPVETVRNALAPLLESVDIAKLGHNLKYDYTVLRQQWGVRLQGRLIDTLIAAHLLEIPGHSLKLDDLCREFGLRLTPFAAVTGGDKRPDCFAYVGMTAACHYSCEDVYGAMRLWREYEAMLQDRQLDTLFFEVEMPLLPLLADMEIRGICVDQQQLQQLAEDFGVKLGAIERDIFQLAGREFNINSPKQLGTILFEELGLAHGRKTKTGYSTDVKVLEKLARKHELPAKILDYRSLAKLQSTYVEKLAALQDPATGRVHTSFNQAVTATGRLSSSNPNLQNIPIRTEEGNRIRRAFVPGDGFLFLSADYSQIDLRVLAHYSGDAALVKAFNNGEDIHARTAVEVFGVAPLFVTSEMRRVAKSINFGIVYGMSSFGLASQLDISRKEAQTFIDRYFRHYAGVKRFMEEIVTQARRNGYVTTLLHRRRAVPEIDVKNKARREFAERTAINTPIQGTAADIIKLAMLAVDAELRRKKIPARLLLQIHDELVFELLPEHVEAASQIIRQAMEGAMQLAVPLVVNIETGTSLAK